ncbi:hypothetical protein OB919_03380 [Halobacteria archaeon AArc-curdl1]|uniref:Uncharacterized protein n=1 Tax=Natronosalvus hydrolyticus TaxID=2979988 RepID=A0AAP3E5H6_9EURY|nr:hypothetical protein [Halobacteria archaeon AArc-curdl1]
MLPSLSQLRIRPVNAAIASVPAQSHVVTREMGRSLEELILDLLQGEFAGIIRSHIRGEVYGGC